MKLNLLFIVMNLLTILAYTIVFMHGKLRWYSKSKGNSPAPNLMVPIPTALDGKPIMKV